MRQRLLWAVLADCEENGKWVPRVWGYLARDHARRCANHLRTYPRYYRNVRVVRFQATKGAK